MGTRALALPARLDQAPAAPLAQQILTRRGAALDLRCGAVERVGTPALQVLLAAARTWRADGHRLRLTGRSAPLEEAVQALGLDLDALQAPGGAA